jgi:hypothetical protein
MFQFCAYHRYSPFNYDLQHFLFDKRGNKYATHGMDMTGVTAQSPTAIAENLKTT